MLMAVSAYSYFVAMAVFVCPCCVPFGCLQELFALEVLVPIESCQTVEGSLEIGVVLGVILELCWPFVLEVLALIESDQVEPHWDLLAFGLLQVLDAHGQLYRQLFDFVFFRYWDECQKERLSMQE
jgi:hypothetical protein